MTTNYYLTSNGNFASEDELYHYGVLGMKWGIHRAQRNAYKADIAKRKAKEYKNQGDLERAATYSKKASKYSNRAQRIQAKHTRRVGGTKAYNYTKNQSVGKAVVKSTIFGTYGALKYNEARANGSSRGKAVVNGLLYQAANAATSGAMSVVEPRVRAR